MGVLDEFCKSGLTDPVWMPVFLDLFTHLLRHRAFFEIEVVDCCLHTLHYVYE